MEQLKIHWENQLQQKHFPSDCWRYFDSEAEKKKKYADNQLLNTKNTQREI